MDIISVSNARSDLFNIIKEVNESHKPKKIINKSGSSAVILSLDDWNAIEETLYLSSIPGLAERIIKASQDESSEFIDEKDVEW